MKYIEHKGIRVPCLGLGTYPMQGRQCYDVVRMALDIGYRHIDTAESYHNEEPIGEALENSKIPRNEIFLTTKCGFLDASRENVKKEIESSLVKLRTDYVDLLLYHWHHKETPMNETLDALKEIQSKGLTRNIGVGNFTIPLLKEAKEVHNIDIFTNQFESHPLLRQIPLENYCKKNGILVTAHSPIGRGRAVNNEVLQHIGKKHKKSSVQVAIRWQLEKELRMLVPKSTRREGLEENFDVFDFSLDNDDLKQINEMPNTQRGSRPDFEPHWDPLDE